MEIDYTVFVEYLREHDLKIDYSCYFSSASRQMLEKDDFIAGILVRALNESVKSGLTVASITGGIQHE